MSEPIESCPICLVEERWLLKLACGHSICQPCLVRHTTTCVESRYARTCPFCRVLLVGDEGDPQVKERQQLLWRVSRMRRRYTKLLRKKLSDPAIAKVDKALADRICLSRQKVVASRASARAARAEAERTAIQFDRNSRAHKELLKFAQVHLQTQVIENKDARSTSRKACAKREFLKDLTTFVESSHELIKKELENICHCPFETITVAHLFPEQDIIGAPDDPEYDAETPRRLLCRMLPSDQLQLLYLRLSFVEQMYQYDQNNFGENVGTAFTHDSSDGDDESEYDEDYTDDSFDSLSSSSSSEIDEIASRRHRRQRSFIQNSNMLTSEESAALLAPLQE